MIEHNPERDGYCVQCDGKRETIFPLPLCESCGLVGSQVALANCAIHGE